MSWKCLKFYLIICLHSIARVSGSILIHVHLGSPAKTFGIKILTWDSPSLYCFA